MTNVRAGTGAVNVIPPTLDVQFNFRFCPASSEASLRQRVQAILERHGLEFELAWQLAGSPFVTRSGRLVDTIRRVVRQVTGVTPELSTSGGTSDGRFLASIAREVVEFGPVNTSIHKPDERVWIADIAPLSIVYERTAAALLAG